MKTWNIQIPTNPDCYGEGYTEETPQAWARFLVKYLNKKNSEIEIIYDFGGMPKMSCDCNIWAECNCKDDFENCSETAFEEFCKKY